MEDVSVQRWDENFQPDEAAIRLRMGQEGLSPFQWSNGPGDIYPAHSHSYHKVIYVVRGSITFGLPAKGTTIQLNQGDRLELPAGIVHDALVGGQGVVCLEGHW